jgi:hypothetical protein
MRHLAKPVEDLVEGERFFARSMWSVCAGAPTVYRRLGITVVPVKGHTILTTREFVTGRIVDYLPPVNAGLTRCPKCSWNVGPDHVPDSAECRQDAAERAAIVAERGADWGE